MKGNNGEFRKQESGELVGEHMVSDVSTTLSENRPEQLFVHVGAHIIAPITAPALASFFRTLTRARQKNNKAP